MRHLSTSLPSTSARHRTKQPQELLSDFKAAALSVTNLYKTAASAQVQARAAGYQDALDDILSFLDKEDLGLMDGEGWRVRRWATERLDGGEGGVQQQRRAGAGSSSSDDEEEGAGAGKEEVEARSSSPEATRKAPVVLSEVVEEATPPRRVTSEPPVLPVHAPLSPPAQPPSLDDFTFRSAHVYPSGNHDRDAVTNTSSMDLDTSSSVPSSTETVRIVNRASRNRNHTRQRADNRNTTTTLNLNLGAGAGGKRKMPYPDFFDISGVNFEGQQDPRRDGGGNGRGAGGGGKRGRHV